VDKEHKDSPRQIDAAVAAALASAVRDSIYI
jgi:hypothetical protein